jgi:hypothetical protein
MKHLLTEQYTFICPNGDGNGAGMDFGRTPISSGGGFGSGLYTTFTTGDGFGCGDSAVLVVHSGCGRCPALEVEDMQ